MSSYRYHWPNGEPAMLSVSQELTLDKLVDRHDLVTSRGTTDFEIQPVLAGNGAVSIAAAGMHICVERDGHNHT